MAIRKRCHWYDNEGRAREQAGGHRGCRRGAGCSFIHPDEPQWHTAEPVGPPPQYLLAPDPREPHAPRTFSSSYYSPSHRDRGSPPRARRGSPPPRRSLSPTSRDPRGRLRERTPPVPFRSPPPPLRSPSDSSSAMSMSHEGSRSRNRSGHGPPPPSSGSMPPPLPPSVVKHSTPTRSTPTGPRQASTVLREPTSQEKRDTWVERIKLMSDAVIARNEHIKLEKEAQGIRGLSQSWRYVDVSEEDKSRLKSQLAAVDAQYNTKKDELNALLYRLLDADFWPVPPKDMPFGIHGTVQDLQTKVKDLHEVIQKIESQGITMSNSISSLYSKVDKSDRPVKRRRLSNGEDNTDAGTNSQVHDPATAQGLDDLKDRLLALEDNISDMQNELVQYDNHLLLTLQDEMEERFEQYGLTPGEPVSDSRPSAPAHAPPADTHNPEKIQTLENGLNKAGEEIGEIAQEVAELITRTDARNQEITQLHEENQQLKIQITTLQDIQEKSLIALEAQKAEIDSLKSAVAVYVTQSRPEPSPMPSLDDITASCQPKVIDAVREDIRPLLEEMKGAMENMMQTQNTELCNVVLSKVSTTMQTVQTIATWMDSVKQVNQNQMNGVKPLKQAENLPAG